VVVTHALVQQGGELAYLLLHDPEYRCVRREHLVRGRQTDSPQIEYPPPFAIAGQIDGYHFSFYVISAAPEEVIQSALEGIVPHDHIHGTRFHYDSSSGEIQSIIRVPAGYGKVAVLEELRTALEVSDDRVVYVGDGSSDVHVMMHVNHCDGLTVAVSEAKYVTRIAPGERCSSMMRCAFWVPILEEVAGWEAAAHSRSVRILWLRSSGVGKVRTTGSLSVERRPAAYKPSPEGPYARLHRLGGYRYLRRLVTSVSSLGCCAVSRHWPLYCGSDMES